MASIEQENVFPSCSGGRVASECSQHGGVMFGLSISSWEDRNSKPHRLNLESLADSSM